MFTAVTGVSGSGKSTLVNEILYKSLARQLYRASRRSRARTTAIDGIALDRQGDRDRPVADRPHAAIESGDVYGAVHLHPRAVRDAARRRQRGFKPGRFSFNVKGGRCEACQGDGVIAIEMHFLPDVYVTCEECKGRRYNRETLEIRYRGKSIADVLDLTVDQALPLLENVPPIAHKLRTLQEVGLGYIELGQSATTLSGGEAQRVKLARELSKRGTGRTLYILDEPTTGLHFEDVKEAARRARQAGRSGQHGARHRAQPRCRPDCRSRHRSRARKAARRADIWSRMGRRRMWRGPRGRTPAHSWLRPSD